MRRLLTLIIICYLTIFLSSCQNKNHIDKYKIDVEELKKLPDNFYAFRGGRVYHSNEDYRIWYDLNKDNIHDVFKVQDFNDFDLPTEKVIQKYNIDKDADKEIIQRFINLSRKYRFGHIYINREEKIYFSHKQGLAEQYVMAFNPKVENEYANRKDFIKLPNGWFQYK